MCLSVALVGLPLASAVAAVLPVLSCLDDGGPDTLRGVIAQASSGDTINLTQLTCSTITLTKGVIDTSLFGAHPLEGLVIQGPGRDFLTISGGGQSLLFLVGSEQFSAENVFTVNDVTLADGVNAGSILHESPACLFGVRGKVVLNRVRVTNCHSTFVGGFGGGGAVGAAYLLEISDSVISNSSITAMGGNVAAGGGASVAGKMIVVNSTNSGNRVVAEFGAEQYGGFLQTGGGGLYTPGDLTLINSTVTGNSVEATGFGEEARGGGVFVRRTANITGSTIGSNTADGDGGGLFKVFPSYYVGETTLVISNSTVSGNVAGGAGGGIASQRATRIANSTVASNISGSGGAVMFRLDGLYPGTAPLELQSTIIGDNRAGSGAVFAADLATDGVLTVTGSGNLLVSADAAIDLPADTLFANPRLLPLADNGGPTRTHSLAAASPAINHGNNAAALAFDQRGEGYPRESGGRADIGPFEGQRGDAVFADGFEPGAATTALVRP